MLLSQLTNKSIQWVKKYQPIAVISKKIYAYKNGRIYIIHDNNKKVFSNIEYNWKDRLKESNRLFSRFFRTEIRCSCLCPERLILFFKNKSLFKLDLNSGITKKIHEVKNGYSTPLNILASKDDKYIAYWGEYFSNREKKTVNIFGITAENQTEIVYSFPQGTIEHIHNIIHDDSDGFYIFTGDVVEKAGVYHASKCFQEVTPIYIGTQHARAVIGFTHKDGLILATDSPEESNFIYYMYPDEKQMWIKKNICSINGSCIYGTKFLDTFVFSTVVEPSESKKKRSLLHLFSTKRAKGIMSSNIDLVFVQNDFKVKTFHLFKKDALPLGFFQYGCIRIPIHYNENEILCIYPVATKEHDGQMGIIKVI